MTTFSENETAFINATAFHIERDWKGRKGIFADKAGISGGYLSEIIGRKKCPQFDKQENIAKSLGYKSVYEFVEFGKTLTVMPKFAMKAESPPPPPVISFQEEADKKHAAVIAGFKDKEKAIAINQLLIEVEKRAPEKLERVIGYLENMLADLPENSKKGQSTGTNGGN